MSTKTTDIALLQREISFEEVPMPYDYPPAHTAVPAVRPVNLRRSKPGSTQPVLAAARRRSPLRQPDQQLHIARHVLQAGKPRTTP